MRQAPGDNSRWFWLLQSGEIYTFENKPEAFIPEPLPTPTLDLRGIVYSSQESGLLDIAFHPEWQTNRTAYVTYITEGTATLPEGNGHPPSGKALFSHLARIQYNDATGRFDPPSEDIIKFEQPKNGLFNGELDGTHKGGHIEFLPDGKLYWGIGDCGHSTDGQFALGDAFLCGKMIAVDVNTKQYSVIAAGLRNPWRWNFDPVTQQIWIGDVGNDSFEEVDFFEPLKVTPSNIPNFGWPYCEGTQPSTFEGGRPGPVPNHNKNCAADFTQPVYTYTHENGRGAIMGGYIYRGSIQSLYGKYIFGDMRSREVWAADPFDFQPQLMGLAGDPAQNAFITSLSQDLSGEVYVVLYGDLPNKIVPADSVPPPSFATKLSETGCMNPSNPVEPASGLIPYNINVPFWSDGAVKSRWMALPDGKKITIGADGHWQYPEGTVFVKNFYLNDKIIETRFFARHMSGEWGGYSYQWDEEGKDATLLPSGFDRNVGGQIWHYPSPSECMRCHNAKAQFTLGPETDQMNLVVEYPSTGLAANQIATLDHIGMFDAPLSNTPDKLPVRPPLDGSAPVGDRAHAWLATNCSFCHHDVGITDLPMDFRYTTPISNMKVCNERPVKGDLGIADAYRVAPGDPARSVLHSRISRRDGKQMPPLATRLVDDQGVGIITEWIQSLSGGCP